MPEGQIEAAGQSSGDQVKLRRHLDNASDIARQSLAEARRSVAAIRPKPLDGSGLPDALEEVATKWSERSRIPVQITVTGDRRPIHPEIEVALLRAAQEALTNVDKHANATRTGVTLSFMADSVALDVRDDGSGMTAAASAKSGSFGLAGMRQRINRLKGEMSLESAPGEGTALSVRVPTSSGVSADG